MILERTIRNGVRLALAINGIVTSKTLADLFPDIIDGVQSIPERVFVDEDSCMDFIQKHFEELGRTMINDTEEPKEVKLDTFDPISRPSHYTEGRKYEPRKVIADWGLNFNLGNAVKYLSRAGRKGDKVEDLRKAIQYIEFEIEELINKEVQNEETEA